MALVLSEKRGRVGLVALNRPEALNALNAALLKELVEAVAAHDADDSVGAIVVTGSERAFAAGADIKEMAEAAFPDAYARDRAATLSRFAARKPLIAAVAGHALGGGCELALACDIIIAADTAKFGQPEITLGIIPGMGGTQRLPRAVGKAQAMDMILTARIIDAAEALGTGLVSRVVPASELSATAFAVAEKIAALSLPAVIAAKESIARAYELPLAEGVRRERELFHALFATEDQKEGMAAFIAKRPPDFRNR